MVTKTEPLHHPALGLCLGLGQHGGMNEGGKHRQAARRRKLSTASWTWLIVTAAMAGIAVLSLYSMPPDGEQASAGVQPPPVFDLQGHRGARGLAPENSLPGLETALAIGITTLELDLGLTADGTLVVHHDRRLDPDRTRRDGRWLSLESEPAALNALTFAELQAYDVGRLRPDSKAAGRFPDQAGQDDVRVPSLRDYLARAEELSGGRMRYNLETKLAPGDPTASPDPKVFAEALVTLLTELDVAGRSSVQSFDWRSLEAVQALAPEIPTVYLSAEQSWLDTLQRGRPGASPWTAGADIDKYDSSPPLMIKDLGGAVWSPFYRDLREPELFEAKRLGLRVVVWTVNDPADMASLIELGVDGIITDYPDRLRAVMEAKGLPLPPPFPGEG